MAPRRTLAALRCRPDQEYEQVQMVLVGLNQVVWTTTDRVTEPHKELDQQAHLVRFRVRLNCSHYVTRETVIRRWLRLIRPGWDVQSGQIPARTSVLHG